MTRPTLLAIAAACALSQPAGAQQADTVFVEVGSPAVNGTVFEPHAARVRIWRGDTLVAEWVNRLTLGDSAGRKVMRWVTTGNPVPSNPNRVTSVLRQTYDAVTMAPLGYWSQASNGAYMRLRIADGAATGTRRTAMDTTPIAVNIPVPRAGFFAGASDLVPVAAGLKEGAVIVAPVWSPGLQRAEDRVFHIQGDTTVDVEGTMVRSRKVVERKRSDGSLQASWYLLLTAPYMVYGEVPLPDGRIQRMTEVPVP